MSFKIPIVYPQVGQFNGGSDADALRHDVYTIFGVCKYIMYVYGWGPKNRANSNYTWLLICKPGILQTISFDRLKSLTSNQQTDGHKHGRNQTKWSYIYIYNCGSRTSINQI